MVVDRVLLAADGDVLVILRDGSLARMDETGRSVRWRHETVGQVLRLQRVVFTDQGVVSVTFQSRDGRPVIDGVSWKAGKRQWLIEEQRADKVVTGHSDSALLPGGRAFHLVGVNDRSYVLYYVDAEGQQGWTRDIPDESMARVVAYGERVFVIGMQRLLAIDPASGSLSATWDVSGPGSTMGRELVTPQRRRIGSGEVDLVAIDMSTLAERVVGFLPSAGSVGSFGRHKDAWFALIEFGPARVSVFAEGGHVGGGDFAVRGDLGGEGERFVWQIPPGSGFPLYDLVPAPQIAFASPIEGVIEGRLLPIMTWSTSGASLTWLDLESLSVRHDLELGSERQAVVRRMPHAFLVVGSRSLQVRSLEDGHLLREIRTSWSLGLKVLGGEVAYSGDDIFYADDDGTLGHLRLSPEATTHASP